MPFNEDGSRKEGPLYKKSGFKMKGSPMQRNFGISPMKDEKGKGKGEGKKKKVLTDAFKARLRAEGLSDEEVQALVIRENQAMAADTTGDYANKPVARYEGSDYTQKELDTAARIKKRKQGKGKKK